MLKPRTAAEGRRNLRRLAQVLLDSDVPLDCVAEHCKPQVWQMVRRAIGDEVRARAAGRNRR